MQCIEPTARLILPFSNKLGRESGFKFFLIFFTLKEHGISYEDIDFFKNYDKIFINNNYDDFIVYSFIYNKPKILELLKDINPKKLENDVKRLFPTLKFNITSKMVKNCQIYNKNIFSK